MFSLMDGVFIQRRCYLKLGDGAVLSFVRLRADCFFRHWSLKAAGIDAEGYIQAIACAPPWRNRQASDVFLRIDPMTSFVLEFSYMDNEHRRVFRLVDSDYHEQVVTPAQDEQAAC
jgi:hypothetical protein